MAATDNQIHDKKELVIILKYYTYKIISNPLFYSVVLKLCIKFDIIGLLELYDMNLSVIENESITDNSLIEETPLYGKLIIGGFVILCLIIGLSSGSVPPVDI